MLNPYESDVYRKVIFKELNDIGIIIDEKYIEKIEKCIDTEVFHEIQDIIIFDIINKINTLETKRKIENVLKDKS